MSQNIRDRAKAKIQAKQTGKPSESKKTRASRPAKEHAEPAPICPTAGLVDVWFDCMSSCFFAKNLHGEYMRYPERALSLLLREAGFQDRASHANGLTFLESELLRITKTNTVHYAGPLGGYKPGVYEMGGNRVLVTRGATHLDPVAGKWPVFKRFLLQLLGEEGKYFCAWVKSALMSLKRGRPWSPGQMLALAGPPGAGKSFLQSLITPLLGGRVSSPYRYMTGGTSFNAEIYGAEHALVGDQNHKTDKQSRRNFGASIKELVVNPEQYVRGLYRGAVTLMPFLRLTVTLNDNPHALLVLPELDSDVSDKIILLHAQQVDFPFPSKQFPDKQSYYKAIIAELPAFLFHLRRWQIPAAIADPRYGVTSYKSPDLVKKMDSVSSEWKLWNLVEMYIFSDRETQFWEGTSAELEKALRDRVKGENLSWLFYYPGACGQYLTALIPKVDGAISVAKAGGNRNYYTIYRS